MSTLSVINLQSQSTTAPVVFQTSTGTEVGQLCRAWVNFNGTTASPSTIRASFNVSSVTKNGTGDYTVNFTNPLADANYSVLGMAGPRDTLSYVGCVTSYPYGVTPSYLTTSVRVGVGGVNGGSPATGTSSLDSSYVHVAIFR